MFWKRYHKRFSVRMEIIANNAIIIFCHLVEFAIFSISDSFSRFSIAVFNVPITHIIMFLLFLMQSYNLFSYFQTFFNFFSFLAFRSSNNHKFCFYAGCPVFLSFPAVFRVRMAAFTFLLVWRACISFRMLRNGASSFSPLMVSTLSLTAI